MSNNYKIMAHNGDNYVAVERGAGGGRELLSRLEWPYYRDEDPGVIMGIYHGKFLNPATTSQGTRLTWHSQGTWLT